MKKSQLIHIIKEELIKEDQNIGNASMEELKTAYNALKKKFKNGSLIKSIVKEIITTCEDEECIKFWKGRL